MVGFGFWVEGEGCAFVKFGLRGGGDAGGWMREVNVYNGSVVDLRSELLRLTSTPTLESSRPS